MKSLNAYLIRGQERHPLVDAGYNRPECLASMCEALDALDIDRSVLDIFLTHLHADHSGLSASLGSGNSTFYASAPDGESINNLTRGPVYWTNFLHSMRAHGFSEVEVKALSTTHPAILYCPARELVFHIYGPVLKSKKAMEFFGSDANIYSASTCIGSALMVHTRSRSSTLHRRFTPVSISGFPRAGPTVFSISSFLATLGRR